MWQHVKEEVLSHNYDKYRKELSAEEIALFETVAGSTLQKLGYTLDFPYSLRQTLSTAAMEIYTSQNKQWKIAAKSRQTCEDAAKRKRQDALLNRLTTAMENLIFKEEMFANKIAV